MFTIKSEWRSQGSNPEFLNPNPLLFSTVNPVFHPADTGSMYYSWASVPLLAQLSGAHFVAFRGPLQSCGEGVCVMLAF